MYGTKLSKMILNELKSDIQKSTNLGQKQPKLTAIQVGNDPASTTYLRKKQEACQFTGIDFNLQKFSLPLP